MPKIIYYCKSLVKTGKPIIVKDLITGKEKSTDKIKGDGKWSVVFSKRNKRGARAVLKVW